MPDSIFLAVNRSWLRSLPKITRLLGEQHLVPLGTVAGDFGPGCRVLVKVRAEDGGMLVDDEGELTTLKQESFLRSHLLSEQLLNKRTDDGFVLFYFEGSSADARCAVLPVASTFFENLEEEDPSLRLEAFQLPPSRATSITSPHLVEYVFARLSHADPDLFGVHASNFLNAPHILVPLFDHVLGLSSSEQIEFPSKLKRVAEQLRALLLDNGKGSVRIERISRDHNSLWADVLGDRISFVDGGIARVAGMPGSEPLAIRVGVYTVRPGLDDLRQREEWALKPYVIGDIIEPTSGDRRRFGESPDRKRLQEAARYVLEPLTALAYLTEHRNTRALFLHGPMVNQFVQYDEGEPNFIPSLKPTFLESFGITKDEVETVIERIPSASGQPLWNQFMAVYGFVQKKLFRADWPIVGVVERSRGQWLGIEILDRLVQDGLVRESYARKVQDILNQYEISDDFLFGCVLSEGEYTTPITIPKNFPGRARERWKSVVEQYPKPFASALKTSETAFPFRVELNRTAAEVEAPLVFRLLYHTSRLLPSYAFPVGLDIVDKYAKVPDWIARGVSGRLAAEVLRRALRTGDPRIVGQVRQFLAHTPRDFFYRPEV